MIYLPNLRPAIASIVAAASLLAATAVSAETAFDGLWSVRVMAKATGCEMSYAVPIQVQDGAIIYAGRFKTVARGKVEDDGALAVELAHNGDVVQATGALAADSGTGKWVSPTMGCEGTWTARKV